LPTLADSGNVGAGIGIHTPFKQPEGNQILSPDNRTYNRLLRALHCLGERGSPCSKVAGEPSRTSPSAPAQSATSPAQHLSSPTEHNYLPKFAEITSLRPAPDPITDPKRITNLNMRRRDRRGGVHEYSYAA
jgi:hypothetical protein